jgi:hypothetical protein
MRKKYLLVLALTMTCTKVVSGSLMTPTIYRCENEEVICYTKHEHRSGLYCHFKNEGGY